MTSRRRSCLFLPASNPRALAKARELPCDVVILDLEDAVAPEMKDAAREAAVAAEGFGDRMLVVRVNGGDTDWGADDLAALAGTHVDAVLLPKVGSVEEVARARAALGDGPALWAMVESARGLFSLPALAEAAAGAVPGLGLEALVAGVNDLALDLRCRPDAARTPLLPALAQIVAAARAGGMAAIDGVLNAIDDPDRLAAECAQGRMWGFDGKSLIHPSQIDAANAAFGPSAEEVAWAERVIAVFAEPANADKGAVRLDGSMVERLHLVEAERVLTTIA